MSRKSIIFCLTALAAMVVMIVAAVAFLYRDEESAGPVQSRYDLAYAIPSNAVMVCFLADASSLSSPVMSSFAFHRDLAEFLNSDAAGSLSGSRMAVSLHYSGSLAPFYVLDAGASDAASASVQALVGFAASNGYNAEFVKCSDLVSSGPLVSQSLVLMAKTKAQLSIAKSHIREGRSVMDAPGFTDIAQNAPQEAAFFSYDQAKVLFEKSVQRSYYQNRFSRSASEEYSNSASFFRSLAQWGSIALDNDHVFELIHRYDPVHSYMAVLDHSSPSVSEISQMLPSHTSFVLTLPMLNDDAYLADYAGYLEAAQKKASNTKWQDKLKADSGVSPSVLMEKLGVTEVATAAFTCGGNLQWVNLVRISREDPSLLRGTDEKEFGKSPKVYPFSYAGSIASVYGKIFRLADESHFTVMNGWLITGSRRAIEEYVSDMALSYDLKTYMEDAGKADLLAERVSTCVVYMNFPAGDRWLKGFLGKEVLAVHDSLKGEAEYEPIVMSVFNKGGIMHTDVTTHHLNHLRSRAPKYDRDTTVTIPSGPFKVINSGTGRTNLFYQQSNGAICLKEEGGKGLWGVPFKKPLCGRAHNIDYYANGNKQILFGAGSELYLIDRFGRFVTGFPSDLGKEILLGPDVYDFNGVHSYNVMVLHKDKTIEMYNLRGKKPDSWKGIRCNETIKSLPERLIVGDRSFWVVRTSIQTLIYSFYGGEPLTSFSGDQMFRPDAQIKVVNPTTVEAESYDGIIRAVKLR